MKKLLTTGAAVLAAFAALAEDAYIESNGANTINTGYYANPKTKLVVDFKLTEVKTGNDTLLGHYGNNFAFLIYCPATDFRLEAKDGVHKDLHMSPQVTTDTARYTAVIDAPRRHAAMYAEDGTLRGEADFPADWTLTETSNWPLLLFGSSQDAAGTSRQRVKARIYNVKIYETENGVEALIHNYVPATKDGYVGFYDAVTGDFFSQFPTSAAAFTCGGDVMEVDGDSPYVEADSSFFSVIDTRYFPNNKTKVEVDFRQMELVSGSDCIFGHWGNDYTLLLYGPVSGSPLAGTYKLVARDGTYSGLELSPSVAAGPRRHTAVIDIPNRHVEMRTPEGAIQGQADLSSKDWTWKLDNVTCPFALFASSNDSYGHMQQRVKARIFSAKIYENANADGSGAWTAKHVFLPCKKEGIVGFKDQITGNFLSGANLTAGGDIPAESETDPYIDTGTSGAAISFDTGHYATANTCVVCDFMPLKQQNAQQFPFEAGDPASATNANEKSYMRMYGNGSIGQGDYSYACGKSLYISTSVPYQPNVRRKLTLDAYNGRVKVESNGEVLRDISLDAACRNPNPSSTTLKILSNGTGNGGYCMARLYSFQIYEEGVLVRDYRPYVKSGVVGLRDVAGNGGFITASNPSGSLLLTCGGGIEGRTDAYVQNDGITALNLGYKANMKTRIEYDFQSLSQSGSKVYFGAWNDGTLLYCCWNNAGKFRFNFGGNSTGHQTGTDITVELKRYTAIMDMKNWALALVIDGVTNNIPVNSSAGFSPTDASISDMGAFDGIVQGLAQGMTSHSRIYAVRIYEDDVLEHEFLPYKNGDVVSLYDTRTGYVATKTAKSGVSDPAWPTIGGKGVDGEEKWLVVPQGGKLTKEAGTKLLSANASGAQSYKWTKNGTAIEGGTDGNLTVEWVKGGATDTYAVTPVYSVFGNKVEGAALAATVENLPQGLMIVVQ